ncbi:MAG: HAD-IA family hydrolase [Cytophagales bacterium]|nr:HAD-IA family hydrolase [Armatimonadota bacterium]
MPLPVLPLFPTGFHFRPRAALFDLDGTLVRTFIDFPAMRREMQALSARLGAGEATAPLDDILEIVAAMAQTLGGEPGETARRDAYALLEAMEADGCAHPERIEGSSELLSQLRGERGARVGIITRNCRRVSEALLARMDLPHDILIAREDTTEFKPHPAPVLLACARLGVDPAEATMTGDLWADIAAGSAAGVRATIGLQWPHDPPLRFARHPPDFTVGSVTEATTLLLG